MSSTSVLNVTSAVPCYPDEDSGMQCQHGNDGNDSSAGNPHIVFQKYVGKSMSVVNQYLWMTMAMM